MNLRRRRFEREVDYWLARNFLREVFLLNDRREISWHVARLDYWRWHFINNLQCCPSLEEVMFLWETDDGRLAAILHPFSMVEAFLVIHPGLRSAALEAEMIAVAEAQYGLPDDEGVRRMFIMANEEDKLRQEVLAGLGYTRREQLIHRWWRDLDEPLPQVPLHPGYTVRALGERGELPARSWASWRAFHPAEEDEAYEGWEWYLNLQAAPLYRRDLDLVAVTDHGEIASFCTIFYDDYTRSAVCVLVGTAAEHQRRGLGKAVIAEGLRRLEQMGATRVFANAYDEAADGLYGSILGQKGISHSWVKVY